MNTSSKETDIRSESAVPETIPFLIHHSLSDEDVIYAVGQSALVDIQRANKLEKVQRGLVKPQNNLVKFTSG